MKKIQEITLESFNEFCTKNSDLKMSQIQQDLFVLFVTEMKQNGFFVEFGACDGVELTNTLTLEKNFGWNGILSEPCKFWHEDLFKNRKCFINTDAVWKVSGEKVLFNHVEELKTISNIDLCQPSDGFMNVRLKDSNSRYEVNTISLMDLLSKFESPKEIDYISIDTEGSEYEIISNFDFNKYDVKIITIEHNHTIMRDTIYQFLTNKGYTRVLTEITGQDDWYIKN